MSGARTTRIASYAFGGLTALGLAGVFAASTTWTHAQQRGAGTGAVAIDADDIGGVVTGAKGPEAGVWVVAETTDTPTRFIRSVVTDDQGRYVVPDLPRAKYQVFVRGYGLVDSPKVGAAPGQPLNLKAVPAPDPRAAAQIYPAAYWLSLMEIPKGAMPEREVLSAVKECLTCHQLGNQGTREISKALGTFPNSLAAWDHRVTVGPMGLPMSGSFQRFGEQRRMFAEWTDKIAAGAVPTQVPPRPSGLERNVVVTLWDWAVPTGGRSDGAASDDRIGTNNANGPIWGVIQSDDLLLSIDPVANRAEQIVIPTSGPSCRGAIRATALRAARTPAMGRRWTAAMSASRAASTLPTGDLSWTRRSVRSWSIAPSGPAGPTAAAVRPIPICSASRTASCATSTPSRICCRRISAAGAPAAGRVDLPKGARPESDPRGARHDRARASVLCHCVLIRLRVTP
jgi:hypothetical protein